MEMKSLVLCAIMVAASLLASPATARDPFVGLSVEGSERRAKTGRGGGGDGGVGDGLECCNNCQCDRTWGWCTCKDINNYSMGCPPGCEDCRCSLWPTMSCVCSDMMKRCPESCGMRRQTTAPHRGTAAGSTPAQPNTVA